MGQSQEIRLLKVSRTPTFSPKKLSPLYLLLRISHLAFQPCECPKRDKGAKLYGCGMRKGATHYFTISK